MTQNLFNARLGLSVGSTPLNVIDASGNATFTSINNAGTLSYTANLHDFTGAITSNNNFVQKGNLSIYTSPGSMGLYFKTTSGVARWVLYTGTAESGSNSGSNLTLSSYTDEGTLIDTPITVYREAGSSIQLNRNTFVKGALYANEVAGATKSLGLTTSGLLRWSFASNSAAESGSNAGSNFALGAWTDAGAFIDNPIEITRAAGGTITFSRPSAIHTQTPKAAPLTGCLLHLVQIDSSVNRIVLDSFNSAASQLAFRVMAGSKATPTAIASGVNIASFGSFPYITTTSSYATNANAKINFASTETYSSTTLGSSIILSTTLNGSTTVRDTAIFDNDGSLALNYGPLKLAASTGIVIPTGAPGTTTNTLYQVSGSLYFNGAVVGGAGGGDAYLAGPQTFTGYKTFNYAKIKHPSTVTEFEIDTISGYNAQLQLQNNAIVRTILNLSGDGSRTSLYSYDSTGTVIDTVMSFDNITNSTLQFGRPAAGLCVGTTDDVANPNVFTAEKTIVFTFPNAVANQKADIRLGNIDFGGILEVTVSSNYSNQNAAGSIKKIFAIGTSVGGSIWQQQTRYAEAIGATPTNFAISDVTWDATNSTFRIQIVHRVSTGNFAVVNLRWLSEHYGHADISALTKSAVYTTDTTTFATPTISLPASTGLEIVSGAPDVTTNKLYQVSSSLYFNGAVVGGGGSFGDISTKTANYTVLTTDSLLLCNGATAGFTITLTASPGSKQQIIIKKIDSTTNSIVISGNGKTIDGSATTYINTLNEALHLIYDGTNWQVI